MNRQDDCLISKSTSSSTSSSWVPFSTKADFTVKNEGRSGLAMSGRTKRAGNVVDNKVKESGGRICPPLDRHCVRISQTISVTFIPSHYDYSKEEKEAQWYTRPEIKKMLSSRKHRRTIEVAPGLLETEQGSKKSGESLAELQSNESKRKRSRSRERSGIPTRKNSDQESDTLRASIISNASDATDRATTGELFELLNRSIESPTHISKTNIKCRGDERIGTTLIFSSEDCAASKHFTPKELNKETSAQSNQQPREHQKRLSPLNKTQPTPRAWDASSRSIFALKHDKIQAQITRTKAVEMQNKQSSRLGAAMLQVARMGADAASPASHLNNKLGDRAKERAIAAPPGKRTPGQNKPVKRGKASESTNKACGPSEAVIMKTSERLERLQLELGRIRRSAGVNKSTRSGGLARTNNRAVA